MGIKADASAMPNLKVIVYAVLTPTPAFTLIRPNPNPTLSQP